MKIVLSALLLLSSLSAFAGNVVVVNSVNDSKISSSDIKKLFLARKGAFNNGEPAKLATLDSDSEVRKEFNQSILNKSESQYTGYWAKMRFTGRATPPIEFQSSVEVRAFVIENKNAIGVMDDADVTSDVRVVFKF